MAAAACFAAFSAEAPKKASSKTNANYRQSQVRKATTLANPYALTAKKIKEDPAAAAVIAPLYSAKRPVKRTDSEV